jgi:hypothetical protein
MGTLYLPGTASLINRNLTAEIQGNSGVVVVSFIPM